MVVSAKDTQSAGVGSAHAAQSGDPLFPLHDGERWFVAQTLCHREQLAHLHLGAQGFRSFLPRFHKTVRHARSLREVITPVFPGYIFVVLNPERDRWRSINGTFGVARLVSAHQRPMPVPTGVVEALLATRRRIGPGAVRSWPQTGAARARGRRSLRAGPGRAAAARRQGARSSSVECHGPPVGGHDGSGRSDGGLIFPFASLRACLRARRRSMALGERFTRSAVACEFSFLPVSRAARRGAFCDRRQVLETRDIRGGELVCAIAGLDFHTSDLCPCRLRGPAGLPPDMPSPLRPNQRDLRPQANRRTEHFPATRRRKILERFR